ncbi:hypothetical protein GCM10009760_51490 [Kitasatospora kazusensis]|uniref:Uncharacterized protein n=1 Tax=Kitasatospora kazusensis TaxID=407974 RepID=A0ABN3A4T4_9ACTN
MNRQAWSALVERWLRGPADAVRAHPLIGRLTRQLIRVNVLDTATRMAAQTFLTGVPVLFVIAAFAPDSVRSNLLDSLRTVLGLQGASLDEVRHIFASDDQEAVGTGGAVGILVTLVSATACSRVLQRLCERSWHLPHTGVRLAAWRWFAWLLVWLGALLFQGRIHAGFGGGAVLGTFLSLLSGTLMWWWTQHMLLGGRLAWLPLLPGALLTAVSLVTLAWVSKVYVPHALNRSITQFGPFGLVFTMFSWLIVIFTAVTLAIAIGQVLAHEPALADLLGTPPDEDDPPPGARAAD